MSKPFYVEPEKPAKNTPWPLKPEPTKQEKENAFKEAFISKKDKK